MITLRFVDSSFLLDVFLNPPNVYLDHCVVRDFATDPKLGIHFRDTLLQKKGTLCVSALHLIELSGICPGPTYTQIKSYLATFENNFAIIEYDPSVLISRERGPADQRHKAPVDFDLSKQIFMQRGGLSKIDFSILLDILEQHPDITQAIRDMHTETKSSMLQSLRNFRKIYITNVIAKKNADNVICPDPVSSSLVEYVFCHLRYICVREDFKDTDVIDLFHAIPSTSYTDFVVLDKTWARRVRGIPVVPRIAKAFGTNEYDLFLKALAA